SISVGPLRLSKLGRSIADCTSIFQSRMATSALATKPMMRLPPGLPIAMSKAPVRASKTRNGAMELRGRFPGATLLATWAPPSTGNVDEAIVGAVVAAVGEGEALGVGEHVHRLRRIGTRRRHIEARHRAEDLQYRDAARGRRRHAADLPASIGAAQGLDIADAI